MLGKELQVIERLGLHELPLTLQEDLIAPIVLKVQDDELMDQAQVYQESKFIVSFTQYLDLVQSDQEQAAEEVRRLPLAE